MISSLSSVLFAENPDLIWLHGGEAGTATVTSRPLDALDHPYFSDTVVDGLLNEIAVQRRIIQALNTTRRETRPLGDGSFATTRVASRST